MRKTIKIKVFRLLVAGVLLSALCSGSVFAVPGYGGGGSTSAVIVRVDASSDGGSGYSEFFTDLVYEDDGFARWAMTSPVSIFSSTGSALGTIESLSTAINPDPIIAFGFNVRAFDSATTFTITSTTLSFPGLVNPDAVASAAITVTDNTGNGAWLQGLYASDSKSYRAQTNLSDYAFLVDNLVVGPNQSATVSESHPITGFEVIPGTVTTMTASFNFILSPNDSASGTSVFYVAPAPVPEPATMVLVTGSLAGLFLHRRRKN